MITILTLAALADMGCKSRGPAPATEVRPTAAAAEKDAGAAGKPEQVAAASQPEQVAAASQPLQQSAEPDHDDGDEPVPFAPCPLAGDDSRDPERLLDQAADSYATGDFAIAYGCADTAADLLPRSVDAHHIRAAAAAALGYFDAAQVAFSMALALDPDDPETLAAAADFYINVLPPKRRETTLVGLEHARRGRARAVVRRRTGHPLRARLALLEAQAYNDLGQPDEALERAGEAMHIEPDLLETKHERGVALFNLCRFEDAAAAFTDVLSRDPEDPYAHHHLGLIYERLGRSADSEARFRRARELAPGEFAPPVLLSPEAFQAELARALSELPEDKKRMLEGVSVTVEDVPHLADLTAVDPPFSPTILGLFRGLPQGVDAPPAPPGGGEGAIPARAIVLYRKNLARAVKARDELDVQIRRTLHHEIGHLDGLDEGDLRRRGLD